MKVAIFVYGTGINQKAYRKAVRSCSGIDWTCDDCLKANSIDDCLEDNSIDDPLPPRVSTVTNNEERNRDSLEGPPQIGDASSQELPPLSFVMVEDSSQRMKTKLADNIGYMYTRKGSRGNTTYWVCAKRSCRGKVNQKGEEFHPGKETHNHEGDPDTAKHNRIRARVFKQASKEKFTAAMSIVNERVEAEGNLLNISVASNTVGQIRGVI